MQVTKLSTRDNIVHLETFSATAALFFFRGAILWNGQPLSVREERGDSKALVVSHLVDTSQLGKLHRRVLLSLLCLPFHFV
jgi:hypothetical protein